MGIVSQIMDIVKSVSFGAFYFEIAKTLRNSILINGMLTNCELWYIITQSEIAQLEENNSHEIIEDMEQIAAEMKNDVELNKTVEDKESNQ